MTDQVLLYDSDTDEWMELAKMPRVRGVSQSFPRVRTPGVTRVDDERRRVAHRVMTCAGGHGTGTPPCSTERTLSTCSADATSTRNSCSKWTCSRSTRAPGALSKRPGARAAATSAPSRLSPSRHHQPLSLSLSEEEDDDDRGATSRVARADTARVDAWSRKTLTFDAHASSTKKQISGESLHAYGGYDFNYTAFAHGATLSLASEAFETAAPPALATARGDFALVVLDDAAYAIGGWSHLDWCAPLASVERLALDDADAAWTQAPPLIVARGDKAAAVVGDAIYVVGGEHNNGCYTGSTPVDDVEHYSTGGDEWSQTFQDVPDERFRTAAAGLDGLHSTDRRLCARANSIYTSVCPLSRLLLSLSACQPKPRPLAQVTSSSSADRRPWRRRVRASTSASPLQITRGASSS